MNSQEGRGSLCVDAQSALAWMFLGLDALTSGAKARTPN